MDSEAWSDLWRFLASLGYFGIAIVAFGIMALIAQAAKRK